MDDVSKKEWRVKVYKEEWCSEVLEFDQAIETLREVKEEMQKYRDQRIFRIEREENDTVSKSL